MTHLSQGAHLSAVPEPNYFVLQECNQFTERTANWQLCTVVCRPSQTRPALQSTWPSSMPRPHLKWLYAL
jgi:hypothetical protein